MSMLFSPRRNPNIYDTKDINTKFVDLIKITPTYNIFGKEIDIDTLIIFASIVIILILVICLLIYIKIWDSYFIIFFAIYFLLSLFNLFNDSADMIADQGIAMSELQTQDLFIQGCISIYILIFVFLYSIKIPKEMKYKIYKLLIITILISSFSIFVYQVKIDSSRNIRILKKVKQAFFNQSLVLFCITLYMIFTTQSDKPAKN
jgi:hypothetical protein